MLNLILSIMLFVFTPETHFESGIKNYLGEKLRGYSKWNYTLLTNVEKLAGKKSNIEIDREKDFRIKGEYGYIPVRIYENSKSSSTSFITIKLNLFNKVLCATRKISAGTVLVPNDFEVRELEVTNLKNDPVEGLETIAGCSAKLNIGKDAVLLQNMIRQSKAIKIGDEVTVLYSGSGVEISFPAKARTEGCVGEMIKIVSKDNKTFQAKVIDAGSVIIVE